MSTINYATASFKDFEEMEGKDPFGWAGEFRNYQDDWEARGHWNYRQECTGPCGPEITLDMPRNPNKNFVALVFNDYLGFSQHPAVKAAAIAGIERYGGSSSASPAIGGHFTYHRQIEEKIAAFFKRDAAILYSAGYPANTGTMQALLKNKAQDLAILDTGVHASMYEGCQLATIKTFPHNHMERLERILTETGGQYRTRIVVIDGVYSQQADIAKLDEIVRLCKHYGAYTALDDAHGVGVIGQTGRGVLELYDLYQEVDFITGTFSKTFGNIGGYVVAKPNMVNYLKYQSRAHIFSVSPAPSSCGILKAIDLIDEEPVWKAKLWDNITYLKTGLQALGLNTGNTESAIIPVITGKPDLNAEVSKLLMDAGIYANRIGYPAVAGNRSQIRMAVMATHTREHLDRVLNAWEWVAGKTGLKKQIVH
ncbi:aminotransferase class I/II-fold pyridoxal phosphate-dependent enzyme [Mucilaginibacter sp. dw_454]|uniref:aminotransferase class I/II-fold pyridoxal phosphate-dependent enzyme n=1 Tax=Mucilaginibacter sp. dw_454 TaxID=2720079 RepID=UPI001BD5851E|nr:aminotransferase class I/II-fold pyridoxal phosphate-dependent enzyme [Mucilaginibacter sp. dw_454]